jgi:TonB family protein
VGRCQSSDLPSAPNAPLPSAPAPSTSTSATKTTFELPSATYDIPTGKAPDPKKGWFCDAPPDGIFAEKSGHVSDEMKGEVRSYLDRMHTELQQTWVEHMSRSAKLSAWPKGRVAKLRFVIQEDGSHSGPELTVSSESPVFDNAALDAVRMRDMFPPLPNGYSGPIRVCRTFTANGEAPDHSQDWMKKIKK